MSDTRDFDIETALDHPDDVETVADHVDQGHAHPSDWEYVKIALVLAAITAVEVFTYFRSVVDWGDALIPSLMLMMVLKFFLVAAWFMHLRFDTPLFSRFFVGGILLAAGVYVVMLAVFRFW